MLRLISIRPMFPMPPPPPHLPRCATVSSSPLTSVLSLSLVHREFKECGLARSHRSPTRSTLRRLSNQDNLERSPPRHDVEEGAAEAGKPEQGDGVWKTLAECFQGKNNLISGGCGRCTVVFGFKSLCFIGKGVVRIGLWRVQCQLEYF